MKKYILLPYFLFSFIILLTFSSTTQTYAAGLNQKCGITAEFGEDLQDYGQCDNAAWTCADRSPDDNLDNTTVCKDQQIKNCSCLSNGSGAPGANGWSCDGGPVGYCQSGDACYNTAGKEVDSIAVPDAKKLYANTTIKGIECKKPQATATCKCVGAGTDKQNNFECTLDSDPNQKATAFCGSTQDQCQDAPGQSFTVANGTSGISNASGFLSSGNINIIGIACRKPAAECTCDPSVAPNGFKCTQFGQTQTDTCDSSDIKCVNDPAFIIQNGESTENKIFGGAPLKGIRCQKPDSGPATPFPTIPPPPPPPCKDDIADGNCSQFNTAVGALGTAPEEFITRLFAVLLSLSGGIALLLIIRAGYQMMTSTGKPEQVNGARDQLVAAIVGLVFLIFSFVILQAIGFDILKIPTGGGGAAAPNPNACTPAERSAGVCK